jgi:hypothetical protein
VQILKLQLTGDWFMSRLLLIAATLSLFISVACFAQEQEWVEYASQQDYFTINFPTQPKIENITYKTEYALNLPAHIYSSQEGTSHYSVTVVDYTDAAKMHAERSKQCLANGKYPDFCSDHGRLDLRGAIDFATWNYLKKDAKVTFFAYYNSDLVEGRQLQLTNADSSRTFVAIHMHENRLYIIDGTVPKGAPQPALFQQSMGFIDKEGKRIRYATIYSNAYPPPTRTR